MGTVETIIRPHDGSSTVRACDYETYFGTGAYEARYPAPNPATLEIVLGLIGARHARVLDFGSGNGRYTMPILERSNASVLAYDISPTALALLNRRASGFIDSRRLEAIGGNLDAIESSVRRDGSLDLAMLLFGVLGHIPGRRTRVEVLARLARCLTADGHLVLGVPSRLRRFRTEQASSAVLIARGELEEGDIHYTRPAPDGGQISMFYHLYTVVELEADLAAAGLRVTSLAAESVMPEWLIVKHRPLARLDQLLCRTVPTQLGYGFLAVAAPIPCGSRR